MDATGIGSTAEKLTGLLNALKAWRPHIPLIGMTCLCAYLLTENRDLNRGQVQMLERIIIEKDAKQAALDKNTELDKRVKEAEIEKLQTLLNNTRR